MKTKIGIVGYGNIGKSIEKNVAKSSEFELVGIFSRRDKSTLHSPFNSRFFEQKTLLDNGFCEQIDVLALCVGSAFDLENSALNLATRYNTVDSFDTHAKMRGYISELDRVNKMSGTLSFVGCGWDPGLFSLERALFSAVMPSADPQTFWGKGVSQGHSEAIRKIKGVKFATQYTVPKESAIELARSGETNFATRDKHERVCYVVLDYVGYLGNCGKEPSAEDKLELQDRVRRQIVEMPNYFADYDTQVYFIDEKEYLENHTKMSHAGQVVAVENEVANNRANVKNYAEFRLKLESNPDFTAQVMLAYARANFAMQKEGETGAKTVLDVPVKYLISGDCLKFV